MQAPEEERMMLLDVAIGRATEELHAPVDRVEVTRSRVSCWAGRRRVVMAYNYAQGGQVDPVTGRFVITAGSGSWDVVVVGKAAPGSGWLRDAFSRLLKRAGAPPYR